MGGENRGAPLRQKLCLSIVLLALIAMIWPGYLIGARIEPYVLGLPFSMFWLVLCILVVFGALIMTFRGDMADRRGESGAGRGD